jgi:phosphoglycerate kinase
MLTLQDLELRGKKVLMRVDFNVPLNKDGSIKDNTRLKESLPSIAYILKAGGSVILMSHLGRPGGHKDPHLSLAPCAKELSQLLKIPVQMAKDCIGEEVSKQARNLKPKEVLLLENLRFYQAEENPSLDPLFAKQLASLADIYVNDAFGTAHRNHSSTCAIASYFPGKAAAGLLLQKEIHALESLVMHPKRPFYALIGGAKISTKLGVLKALVSKTDALFVGGAMAFTFFKAQGIKIGSSPHEDDQLEAASNLIDLCKEKQIPLHLPTDLVIANAFTNEAATQIISAPKGIPEGWEGMDIGPATCKNWSLALKDAATIFWNGPFGVFEFPHFSQGTRSIADTLSSLKAITIVGGGDSVAAINQWGLAPHFTHVSTGGGAALEYIEYGHLPGIDSLSKKN